MIAVRIDRSVRHTRATDRRSDEGAEATGPDIAAPMLQAPVRRHRGRHSRGPYLISGASRRVNSPVATSTPTTTRIDPDTTAIAAVVPPHPPCRRRQPSRAEPDRDERHAEPERVAEQQEGAPGRAPGRRDEQDRAEHGPDARRPPGRERHPQREGARPSPAASAPGTGGARRTAGSTPAQRIADHQQPEDHDHDPRDDLAPPVP